MGALASGIPQLLVSVLGIELLSGFRVMFVLYGLVGGTVWLLYRRMPAPRRECAVAAPQALGESKGVVVRLALLFSLDSFAGGLAINALMALWFFQRFELSLAAAGASSSGLGCCPLCPS